MMGNNSARSSKAKLYTVLGALMVLIAGVGAATALGGGIGAEGEGEIEPSEDAQAPNGNMELAADVEAAIEEAEAVQAEGQLAADTALDLEDMEGTEVEAEAAALVEALDELDMMIAEEVTVGLDELPEPELAAFLAELETAIADVEDQLEVLDAISVAVETNVNVAGQEVAVAGTLD